MLSVSVSQNIITPWRNVKYLNSNNYSFAKTNDPIYPKDYIHVFVIGFLLSTIFLRHQWNSISINAKCQCKAIEAEASVIIYLLLGLYVKLITISEVYLQFIRCQNSDVTLTPTNVMSQCPIGSEAIILCSSLIDWHI